MTTAYRTCPLCEATCGLEITIEGDSVKRIRGDQLDVFSRGFICPKGSTLGDLRDDPDRLRSPRSRRGNDWVQISWDEAFGEIDQRLQAIIRRHGPDAVAVYLGNPNVHTVAGGLYVKPLLKALGTRNIYTASTVDQIPKHVSAGLMFGKAGTIPVPDIDRTGYLLMLGADPWVSNGSLATAPDFPGRIKELQDRGGRLVVVDPRRSRTAREADRHIPIRPGTDALFLMAIVHVLFRDGLVDGAFRNPLFNGINDVEEAAAGFSPSAVSGATGVPATTIEEVAHEFASAPAAAAYGRVGTHTVEFGTLASWLVDVINALTGNLDRPGGAMFSRPAVARRRSGPGGRGFALGRWTSRVRKLPEVIGELPVATLADEIATPGDGQIRALVTIAGNPVLSTPDTERLDRALASLELMVSVDPYINATTRHADYLLPPPPALESPHYDFAFYGLSVRNVANYSPPLFAPKSPPEWEIILRLTAIAGGYGAGTPIEAADGFLIDAAIQRDVANPASPVFGLDPGEIKAKLGGDPGPERMLDFLLRTGPYGEGVSDSGLSLAKLLDHPHGIDLGPLEPAFPDILATPSGRVELAPPEILADLDRLELLRDTAPGPDLKLVGRRQLRSNNSWMHNVAILMKPASHHSRLLINPADAARLGIESGVSVRVRNEVGAVAAVADVSDEVMEGVVSLPHGWGHNRDGVQMAVAVANAGPNYNTLVDSRRMDPLSGNAVLNGIDVVVEPVGQSGGAEHLDDLGTVVETQAAK